MAGQNVQFKNLEKILPRLVIDLSRPPSKKERAKLLTRRVRLDAMAESVKQSTEAMNMLADEGSIEEVLVRPQFVRLRAPGNGPRSTPGRRAPSDRRLPGADARPPASRLISPRGASLRFFLTALFEAQAGNGPRRHRENRRPLQAGGDDVISWADLLASPAQDAIYGNTVMHVAEKKARQLDNTLARLVREELIALTRAGESGSKYERFRLMHEGGRRPQGQNVPYEIPLRKEAFPVPVALFTRGWIHVLEDTELVFLLMLAALHHENGGQQISVAGTTRLDRYGIGRNAYMAHVMLSRLGLVTVTPDPSRHLDGKVEGYNEGEQALLHVFEFHPGEFNHDAMTKLRKQIDYQLSR